MTEVAHKSWWITAPPMPRELDLFVSQFIPPGARALGVLNREVQYVLGGRYFGIELATGARREVEPPPEPGTKLPTFPQPSAPAEPEGGASD